MPKLSIDVGDLGGKLAAEVESLAPNPSPLDEWMAQAIESPKGIVLELPSKRDAIRKRFQFYKRRQHLQEAGIHSFDLLMIRIDGGRLHLLREPEVKVIEL